MARDPTADTIAGSTSIDAGAPHVADLFLDEIKTELLHVGARSVAEAAAIKVRHPNAWRFDNY